MHPLDPYIRRSYRLVALTVTRLLPLFTAFALLLILFPQLALAQDGGVDVPLALPADPTDLGAWFKLLWAAGMSKNWWLLSALLISLIVGALRKFVPEKSKVGLFIAGPIGGTITNVLVTWSGALALMLLAGAKFNADMMFRAVSISLAAAGGWSIWKNVKEGITAAVSPMPVPTMRDQLRAKLIVALDALPVTATVEEQKAAVAKAAAEIAASIPSSIEVKP